MLVICDSCGKTHWSTVPWARRLAIYEELDRLGWESRKLPEGDRSIDRCDTCKAPPEPPADNFDQSG